MTNEWILVLFAVAACGKAADSASSNVSLTQADADAVNALVPADLRSKITFDVGTVKDTLDKHSTSYKLVTPKDWQPGKFPGTLEPPKGSPFGWGFSGTHLGVGSNCGGTCTPKDWAAISDKDNFKQYTDGSVKGEVVKDDKQKTSRTLVFEGDSTGAKEVTITRAWWKEGASNYYYCTVNLGTPALALAAAFEKVCSRVNVDGD